MGNDLLLEVPGDGEPGADLLVGRLLEGAA
jgi:hypothetical protein